MIKGLGPGGAERLILNQVAASEADIDYSVAYRVPEKDHLTEELVDAGASVHRLDGLLPVSLRRLIRQLDADVVHTHSPVLAVGVRLLKATRLISCPLVTTEHNRWPRHHRSGHQCHSSPR